MKPKSKDKTSKKNATKSKKGEDTVQAKIKPSREESEDVELDGSDVEEGSRPTSNSTSKRNGKGKAHLADWDEEEEVSVPKSKVSLASLRTVLETGGRVRAVVSSR